MASYKIEDALLKATLEAPNPVHAPECQTLYVVLTSYAAQVPLTQVKFELQPSPPLTYKLTVKHADGRVWRQVCTFADAADGDPVMTFNVDPGWKLSEFANGRLLRDQLVWLVKEFGMTTLNVTFN